MRGTSLRKLNLEYLWDPLTGPSGLLIRWEGCLHPDVLPLCKVLSIGDGLDDFVLRCPRRQG